MSNTSFLSYDLPPGCLKARIYQCNLDGSMTEILDQNGTHGETIPAPRAALKPKRLAGPPVLVRRLREARRALKRAQKVERRAAARVYAAQAALDAANGSTCANGTGGTWTYKTTFAMRPAKDGEFS